jgi:hypothetical protein
VLAVTDLLFPDRVRIDDDALLAAEAELGAAALRALTS